MLGTHINKSELEINIKYLNWQFIQTGICVRCLPMPEILV